MNLHNEIMNIPTGQLQEMVGIEHSNPILVYRSGHRDARHAAAEMSLKAEARIEQLENALRKAQEDINWMLNSEQLLNAFVFDYIDEALKDKQ